MRWQLFSGDMTSPGLLYHVHSSSYIICISLNMLVNGFKSYGIWASFLLALSYQGRKSQKSPAQAIVEGGRLIKGKQEISAITTWRKNIHKMSFKMPCHRYYRLPQTGVWRSRREVLAVGSGQRPSNSSIMDQSRHLTRSPQCSASTPLPLKRGKTG